MRQDLCGGPPQLKHFMGKTLNTSHQIAHFNITSCEIPSESWTLLIITSLHNKCVGSDI